MSSRDLQIAATSPAGFAAVTSRYDAQPWVPARFHLAIDRVLRDVAIGRVKRAVISMPPQHGKTTLVAEYGIPFFLGINPDGKVQLASYAASLAARTSRAAQRHFREWDPTIFGVELGEKQTETEWNVKGRGGEVFAAGVDGGQTGRGASLAIVDDPIKNYQEAQSQALRDKAWDWYTTSLVTRLRPDDGAIVIIMTRWHADDLAGRAMKQWRDEGIPYVELKLKALAEEDDPLGRAPGEPLWPERGYTAAYYEERRREIGPAAFDCLFQQEPARAEGTLFKRERFKYFELRGAGLWTDGMYVPLADVRLFGAVDLAVSLSRSADYTVFGAFARSQRGDRYVLDIVRERISPPEQLERLAAWATRFRLPIVGIEAIAYQEAFFQAAVRRGLPAVPIRPSRDKVTRALAAATAYTNGTMYHLKGAPWLEVFERELLSFPNGAHDDQVDVLAHAINMEMEYVSAPAGVFVQR